MIRSILYIVAFLAMQLLSGAAALALGGGGDPDITLLVYAQLPLSVLLIAALVTFGKVGRPLWRTPRPMRLEDSLAVAGCLVAAFALQFLTAPLQLSDGGMTELFQAISSNVFGLALLCIVGPVTEEIVFRAGVQHHLTRAGLHPLMAAATAAVAFAAVHGNWAQGVPAALLGGLLGYLYYRSGSLRLSIIAHVTNNTVAVALMYIPSMDTTLSRLSPAVTIGTGAVLAALSAALVMRWTRGMKKAATPTP